MAIPLRVFWASLLGALLVLGFPPNAGASPVIAVDQQCGPGTDSAEVIGDVVQTFVPTLNKLTEFEIVYFNPVPQPGQPDVVRVAELRQDAPTGPLVATSELRVKSDVEGPVAVPIDFRSVPVTPGATYALRLLWPDAPDRAVTDAPAWIYCQAEYASGESFSRPAGSAAGYTANGDDFAFRTVFISAGDTTTTSSTTTSTTSTTSTTTAPTTSTTAPSTTPTVALTSSPATASDVTVRPGQPVTIRGGGFAPGRELAVTFFSQPVTLGRTQSDAGGGYSVGVTIPGNAVPGQHRIVVSGPGTQSRLHESVVVVTVEWATGKNAATDAATKGTLPKTGSGSGQFVLSGLAAIVFGVLLFLIRHRLRPRG